MPVAVAQPNKSGSDNQALIGALNIAKDLFRVAMDEKQSRRAQELMSKKTDAETEANKLAATRQSIIDQEKAQDRKINHLKDWRPAKEGEKGAMSLPGYDGLYVLRDDDIRREKIIADKDKASAKTVDQNLAEKKQGGLAELGLKAERQYRQATANKADYDPTSSGQFIDNSRFYPNLIKNNSAIKAHAAQDVWVETFLRDASGAAIPETERGPYREMYFPVAGDDADAVANKEELREQKMRNAMINSNFKDQDIESRLAEIKTPKQEQQQMSSPGTAIAAPIDKVSEARQKRIKELREKIGK